MFLFTLVTFTQIYPLKFDKFYNFGVFLTRHNEQIL